MFHYTIGPCRKLACPTKTNQSVTKPDPSLTVQVGLDYILRGRAARLQPNSREAYQIAVGMYQHALALDPQSVEAQSLLATRSPSVLWGL
jgi:hypothetical protein